MDLEHNRNGMQDFGEIILDFMDLMEYEGNTCNLKR
jgi:hypothetical protein